MRQWQRVVAGVVTTGAAAAATGAIWISGWGFLGGTTAVVVAPSCSSSCSGSITLTATAPPEATQVSFSVDGAQVGTASSSPWTLSLNTANLPNGNHSVTASAFGTQGSANSPAITVNTSNSSGNGGTANVWVSPVGSDTGTNCVYNASPVNEPMDSTTACATFNKAYQLIANQNAAGTVGVEGGSYPSQTISADSAKTSAAGQCRLTPNGTGASFNGTFANSTSGCITIQPASGATVQVGCSTTTTATIGADGGPLSSTIPVVSTAGCPQTSGGGYRLYFTSTFGGASCTGADATDFTGCSPVGESCGPDSGQSGRQACHYGAGQTIGVGVLTVGSSYTQIKNMTVGYYASTASGTTDDIYNGVTTTSGTLQGGNAWFENGQTGFSNNSGTYEIQNCSNCGIVNSVDANETQGAEIGDYYDHASNNYVVNTSTLYYVGDKNYGGCGTGNFFNSAGFSTTNGVQGEVLVNDYFGPLGAGSCGTGFTIQLNPRTANAVGSINNYIIEGVSSALPFRVNKGTADSVNGFVVSGNIGVAWPCSDTNATTYDVTMKYNVDSGTACTSASNPVASNNTGGVSIGTLWTASVVDNLDLTGGPYAWENTWASCPLTVDFHATTRPGTCTPGGDQR